VSAVYSVYAVILKNKKSAHLTAAKHCRQTSSRWFRAIVATLTMSQPTGRQVWYSKVLCSSEYYRPFIVFTKSLQLSSISTCVQSVTNLYRFFWFLPGKPRFFSGTPVVTRLKWCCITIKYVKNM